MNIFFYLQTFILNYSFIVALISLDPGAYVMNNITVKPYVRALCCYM